MSHPPVDTSNPPGERTAEKSSRGITRRDVLKTSVIGLGTAGLAGCFGDGNGSTPTPTNPTPPPTVSPTPSPSPSPSPTPTGPSYETGAAGVPRPTTESGLLEAFRDAERDSLVEIPADTTISTNKTIRHPEFVTVDARGATIEATHGDPAILLNRRSRIYGGTIELGSAGGIGVLNDPRGSHTHKWGPGCFGTHITAEPGSGARGHVILKPPGTKSVFYHDPIFSTDGVDYPLWFQTAGQDGFITPGLATVIANNYRVGITAKGDLNIRHHYCTVDFTPGENTKRAMEIDCPEARRMCTEGWIRAPDKHDQLIRVKRSHGSGGHVHFSYLGHSSERDPGLIRDDAQGGSAATVTDFSGPARF